MSDYKVLNADATGVPTIARLMKFNINGRFTTVSNNYALWFPRPTMVSTAVIVNTRNNGTIVNKTLIGAIDFSRSVKVLNNPVTFVNTLNENRPTQGRVFPIVR